jgi:hypothetical protein
MGTGGSKAFIVLDSPALVDVLAVVEEAGLVI